jgi:hypothetical protein
MDTKVSVGDALEFLWRRYDIPIDINEQAFMDEQVDDVLSKPIRQTIPKMQNVPLSALILLILRHVPSRSGVTFFPRGGDVEISTVRAYRFEVSRDGGIVRATPPRLPRP